MVTEAEAEAEASELAVVVDISEARVSVEWAVAAFAAEWVMVFAEWIEPEFRGPFVVDGPVVFVISVEPAITHISKPGFAEISRG